MQSVACLTQEPEVAGSILAWSLIIVSHSAYSRKAVVSYWRKYHLVLVKCLGGLNLPMNNNMVRLTDHLDMTIAVSVEVKQK